MNVMMFQHRFETLIAKGVKNCTIRSPRKDGRPRAREGETLSLRVWTGLPYRSKQREFAQRPVKFTFPVRVSKNGFDRLDIPNAHLSRRLMVKALGFSGWREARDWYKATHGLPFDGVLVHFPFV